MRWRKMIGFYLVETSKIRRLSLPAEVVLSLLASSSYLVEQTANKREHACHLSPTQPAALSGSSVASGAAPRGFLVGPPTHVPFRRELLGTVPLCWLLV